jgi:hypothetical protein
MCATAWVSAVRFWLRGPVGYGNMACCSELGESEMKLLPNVCASVVALAAFALTANGVSADQSNDQQMHATPKSDPVTKRNKINMKKPNGASTELQDGIKETQKNSAQKQQYKQLENQMQKQQTQLNKQMAESNTKKRNKINMKKPNGASTTPVPH